MAPNLTRRVPSKLMQVGSPMRAMSLKGIGFLGHNTIERLNLSRRIGIN